MKLLVVGVGSIGTRHLENMVALGHSVCAVDTDAARLDAVSDQAAKTFTSLAEALASERFDAALICTFSNGHIAPALQCAKAGCHLFVEKPLSVDLSGTDDLCRVVRERNLVSMVGCNMRFHPAIAAIHQFVSNTAAVGKCLWAGLEYGYSLVAAKPHYASSYMAHRSLGGNLIFDVIHELDYAIWLLGPAQDVVCRRGIVSDLKIDTEDHVDMLIRFTGGTACTVHLDYLQHGYSRRCKVVCEGGTIVWDFAQGTVETILAGQNDWARQEMKLDLYYNQMYVDEMAYFADCVSGGTETFNSIPDSLPALKLAVAADRSCRTGRTEAV